MPPNDSVFAASGLFLLPLVVLLKHAPHCLAVEPLPGLGIIAEVRIPERGRHRQNRPVMVRIP